MNRLCSAAAVVFCVGLSACSGTAESTSPPNSNSTELNDVVKVLFGRVPGRYETGDAEYLAAMIEESPEDGTLIQYSEVIDNGKAEERLEIMKTIVTKISPCVYSMHLSGTGFDSKSVFDFSKILDVSYVKSAAPGAFDLNVVSAKYLSMEPFWTTSSENGGGFNDIEIHTPLTIAELQQNFVAFKSEHCPAKAD